MTTAIRSPFRWTGAKTRIECLWLNPAAVAARQEQQAQGELFTNQGDRPSPNED